MPLLLEDGGLLFRYGFFLHYLLPQARRSTPTDKMDNSRELDQNANESQQRHSALQEVAGDKRDGALGCDADGAAKGGVGGVVNYLPNLSSVPNPYIRHPFSNVNCLSCKVEYCGVRIKMHMGTGRGSCLLREA